MKLISRIKFGLIVLVASLIFSTAHAATLELSLDKNITSTKDDVVVILNINSEGQDINTAQASVSFPTNILEVTKIDRADSIFSFWLNEPTYDNTKGLINFVGGSTSGYTGSSLHVMKVYFKVKGSGSGRMSVDNAAITASDGTGSNVYNTAKGLDINIPTTAEFQSVTLQRVQQAVTLAKQLPEQLGLNVPFYPDQNRWEDHVGSFKATWRVSTDVINAGIALNKNPDFVPGASEEAMLGSKVFPALSDGVWYLHLRLENNIGWSPTLHYRIYIDTVPPSPFKIGAAGGFKTNDPTPTISFTSSDTGSGINNYIVRLDNNIATTTKSTNYTFSPLLPGVHQLTVVAVDKAGNSTSQVETLEILPIPSPEITYVNKSLVVDEGSIVAGGTASNKVKILVQIQNNQKQIVAEQIVPVDESGNWNVTINKSIQVGEYKLLATAKDKNMASSFPAVSEVVSVKQRPVLVMGSLEINQTWFFIILILILLGAFSAGWFSYSNWKQQLGRRVTIAQRDVVNIFNNLDSDIDELLKKYTNNNLDKSSMNEIKSILKNMKNNLEKSRRYVIDNIREIGN